MAADCVQLWRNRFHVYDQAVDVVSCWESFLEHSYSDIFTDYHYERFPSVPQEGEDDDLTPDFTVFFNENYGIIGEVKRTFPDEDVAFDSTLTQIAKYGRPLPLKTGDGNRKKPKQCDTLVIISGTSAPQIGTRIDEKVYEKNIVTLENNLVLLRYQYNTDATYSRYEFQRVPQVDDEFQDGTLPDDISLSNNIGEAGDYGTLEVYPKHFTPIKSQKPLCNDHPPEAYLATIFWHKIFPEYLTEAEYRQWRRGSAQKTIEIEDTTGGFHDSLNSYMHEGRAKRQWIVDTLDYFCEARLAENDGNRYTIGFRDLVRDVGDEAQESTEILQQTKELAYMFINRYCEYADGDEDVDPGTQKSLADF